MTLRLSYYPDITQHRTPQEIRGAIQIFAEALSAELERNVGTGYPIEVLPVLSVRDQTSLMAEGKCEIGLVKPSSYVFAHRRNVNVLPAAVALRVIDGHLGDRYFAQLYAN